MPTHLNKIELIAAAALEQCRILAFLNGRQIHHILPLIANMGIMMPDS